MSSATVTFQQAQASLSNLVKRDVGEKREICPRHALELPPPSTPCLLPPPSDLFASAYNQNEREASHYAEAKSSGWATLRAAVGAKEKFLGAASAVSGFANESLLKAKMATVTGARDASFNRDLQLFLEEFGYLVRSGPTALLSCHEGYVLSDGEPHLVDAYVTTTHLCISGRSIRGTIPLRDIGCIQPSVCLRTTEVTPMFLPLPDPKVKTTALQIYTQSLKVYQFLNFAHSARHLAGNASILEVDPLQLFFAAIDNAWRSANMGVSDGPSE